MASSSERVFERRESSPQLRNNDPDEIIVLNEHRRSALEWIDDARFSYDDSVHLLYSLSFLSSSWVHAKICFAAGIGFFTNAQVYPFILVKYTESSLVMICSPSTSSFPCWAMFTAMKMVEQLTFPLPPSLHSHTFLRR